MNLSLAFIMTVASTLLVLGLFAAILNARTNQAVGLVKAKIERIPTPQVPTDDGTKPVNLQSDEDVSSTISAMKVGERVSVIIKSDRCPWCKKFVAVLDSLKEQNNTILGKVIIRENGPSIKAAVGPVVEAGLKSFRGLPHTVVVDRTSTGYTVFSFAGYVPEEKLPETLASNAKKAEEIAA
jgi:thioredoxin-related protein